MKDKEGAYIMFVCVSARLYSTEIDSNARVESMVEPKSCDRNAVRMHNR